jgi:two-component system sensor histidine kinase BaeS
MNAMRSLTAKLVLAFMVIALLGIALAAFFAGRTTASQFGNFMFSQMQNNLLAQLEDYYEKTGSLQGADALIAQGAGNGHGAMRGINKGPGSILVVDQNGRVVVPGQGYGQGQIVPDEVVKSGLPIEVNGGEAGRLISGRGGFGLSTEGEAFLGQMNRSLILGALGGLTVAVILGIFLARTLTRPLKELTSAARDVAGGDLRRKVLVRSRDELGELAEAFNQMSADLEDAQTLRRQMTADIAHELRTPLSVILAHTEAIRDGVMPADDEVLGVIQDETSRLNTLVEDLRTLSLAEAGELQVIPRPVNPVELLEKAASAQMLRAQQRDITLEVVTAPDIPEINADPDRMAQVLGNLLDNALRYTPEGGRIVLSAEKLSSGVRLSVQDNGPGVAPEEIPLIFHRFYRVDKSRQREEGGSGLGLAIAKSIVERHGGNISAVSNPGEGMKFVIELPA